MRRDTTFQFRISTEEREQIDANAAKAGVSPSAYVRSLALEPVFDPDALTEDEGIVMEVSQPFAAIEETAAYKAARLRMPHPAALRIAKEELDSLASEQ